MVWVRFLEHFKEQRFGKYSFCPQRCFVTTLNRRVPANSRLFALFSVSPPRTEEASLVCPCQASGSGQGPNAGLFSEACSQKKIVWTVQKASFPGTCTPTSFRPHPPLPKAEQMDDLAVGEAEGSAHRQPAVRLPSPGAVLVVARPVGLSAGEPVLMVVLPPPNP